jgi:hypothetical protein
MTLLLQKEGKLLIDNTLDYNNSLLLFEGGVPRRGEVVGFK